MLKVKPKKGKIPIITASNNDFAIMAAALLKSIELNSYQPGSYTIYLLSDGISKRNINKLMQSCDLDIEVIEISKSLINEIELPDKIDYLPKTAYFRLMIPEIFEYFKKVIYLDVDTLVLSDLKNLWEINLENSTALACQCFYEPDHHGLDYFSLMNIDRTAPYFNSGVLVIDVKKWRNERVRENVNKLLNTKLNKPKVMDEEGLNIVLHGKWKAIDQKWNYPPHISHQEDMPNILHYIGYKPIYKDYKGKHQDLFYHYLSQTKWHGTSSYGILKKATIKMPLKLKMMVKKIMTKKS